MHWAELLNAARAPSHISQATIAVLGASSRSRVALGSHCRTPSVLDYTFERVTNASDGSTLELCIYWLTEPYKKLVDAALQGQNVAAVICLDWQDGPSTWPAKLTQYINMIQDLVNRDNSPERQSQRQRQEKRLKDQRAAGRSLTEQQGVNFCVVVTNFSQAHGRETLMDFDEEIEFIQQYLRTVCYKYGAALVFYSEDTQLLPLLLEELQLTASETAPRASITDRILIPSGWDSKEKILVVNDAFDFDAVLQGEKTIPVKESELLVPPSLNIEDNVEPISLESVHGEISEQAAATSEEADSVFRFNGSRDQQQDDNKDALRNFFTHLMDKSTAAG